MASEIGAAGLAFTGTRKLVPAHFAFMRGLVQGLPLRETWERYLGGEGASTDLRVVRTTIDWIRDPSLDEFAAARSIEDFSQAEQIEAFEAEYGTASQRLSRRSRLIAGRRPG